MIIDEDILKDGIDEVLLAKLIGKHSLEQERYEKLYNYYIGKHAICERRRSSDNIANNKIVCNHAKYIVDIAKSYLVGNPVAYSCSDGYDIEAVKNCFAVQDMPSWLLRHDYPWWRHTQCSSCIEKISMLTKCAAALPVDTCWRIPIVRSFIRKSST